MNKMTSQTIAKVERYILFAIMCGFTLVATLYSIYVPIFEASDELWHYPMVEIIASTGTLPVQPLTPGESSGPWRQEGSQPPLYYAIGAALSGWIDTTDMEHVRHLNPHVAAGVIRSDHNNLNLVVHNPALERFPWKGTALAVHVVRFFSVCLGVWAIYLTWALVRELYPQHRLYGLFAAGIHAFTPMYVFISSSVNNDNLIIPLCSLTLLLLVKQIKYKNPNDLKSNLVGYTIIGVVLALAMLTKASGIGLIPLIAAVLAWQIWLRTRHIGSRFTITQVWGEIKYVLLSLLAVFAPVLAISGWWFYRNIELYGEVLGLNAFYAVLGMRDVPADMQQLWSERFAFAAGYWGNFGGLNLPMPQWIYVVLNSLAVAAIAGCLYALLRWLITANDSTDNTSSSVIINLWQHVWPFNWDIQTATQALSWAWPAAVFVSWIRWATVTWSSQGRLIFSAIPMWSLALLLGLLNLIPANRTVAGKKTMHLRTILPSLFTLFLFSLSAIALPLWIVPAYAPPVLDAGEPPNVYIRDFGDVLRLRGYKLHSEIVSPGENIVLTLYWQALLPTKTDYSIFIHILGASERIIAQRDTFPGRGLVSTTWLQPEMTWTETYEIGLSKLAYTPDIINLAAGMYDTHTGVRLPVFDAEKQYQGEMVLFGNGQLVRPDSNIPNLVNIQFGNGILLQGYDVNDVFHQRGTQLELTLYWRATAEIGYDYTVSVQLIDSQWNKAGQNDNWPMNGSAPTSTWKIGQEYVEKRIIDVSSDANPGVYDLRFALYRINASGELEHLPVKWDKGQMPATYVTLTPVHVQ